jgi:hypothetical protein
MYANQKKNNGVPCVDFHENREQAQHQVQVSYTAFHPNMTASEKGAGNNHLRS